jgi:hypothetical protein
MATVKYENLDYGHDLMHRSVYWGENGQDRLTDDC